MSAQKKEIHPIPSFRELTVVLKAQTERRWKTNNVQSNQIKSNNSVTASWRRKYHNGKILKILHQTIKRTTPNNSTIKLDDETFFFLFPGALFCFGPKLNWFTKNVFVSWHGEAPAEANGVHSSQAEFGADVGLAATFTRRRFFLPLHQEISLCRSFRTPRFMF